MIKMGKRAFFSRRRLDGRHRDENFAHYENTVLFTEGEPRLMTLHEEA
jgi:hypothetical protein